MSHAWNASATIDVFYLIVLTLSHSASVSLHLHAWTYEPSNAYSTHDILAALRWHHRTLRTIHTAHMAYCTHVCCHSIDVRSGAVHNKISSNWLKRGKIYKPIHMHRHIRIFLDSFSLHTPSCWHSIRFRVVFYSHWVYYGAAAQICILLVFGVWYSIFIFTISIFFGYFCCCFGASEMHSNGMRAEADSVIDWTHRKFSV